MLHGHSRASLCYSWQWSLFTLSSSWIKWIQNHLPRQKYLDFESSPLSHFAALWRPALYLVRVLLFLTFQLQAPPDLRQPLLSERMANFSCQKPERSSFSFVDHAICHNGSIPLLSCSSPQQCVHECYWGIPLLLTLEIHFHKIFTCHKILCFSWSF